MQLKNRWDDDAEPTYQEYFAVSTDGLTVMCTQPVCNILFSTIRAREPFVIPAFDKMAEATTAEQYFEVEIERLKNSTWIGLCNPHFPLYSRHLFIGRAPFSYGFSSLGDIVASGHIMDDYAEPQFCEGDVIGCGLRIKREQGKAEVFFTRNGLPFCHPIGMPIFATGPALLLYPAVTLKGHFTKVEANFGDDLTHKPFRYNGP